MKLTQEENHELHALETKAMYEGRTCFSIFWHTVETDADRHGELVTKRGDSYNGGVFDGMACGRESHHDFTDGVTKRYAVTT